MADNANKKPLNPAPESPEPDGQKEKQDPIPWKAAELHPHTPPSEPAAQDTPSTQ